MCPNIRECSNIEAKNYVIGFVGRKLGFKLKQNSSEPSWVSLKGKGRLFEPRQDLKNVCETSDRMFNIFHGNGLRKCKYPFDSLCKQIMKENPSFPVKVVKLYCRVKFFARLRHLNLDIKIKISTSLCVRINKQPSLQININDIINYRSLLFFPSWINFCEI